MPTPPLIIAILHAHEEDVHHQLYSQAYGIEMQVDNEWQARLVLLAPGEHLAAVTEDTDVTGEDAAIVSAGVTDVAIRDDGSIDLGVIKDSHNNWLLLGHPDVGDSDEDLARKRDAALGAGCRVIVCLHATNEDLLHSRLAGLEPADYSHIVVALLLPDAPASQVAAAAQATRQHLKNIGAPEPPRVVVAGSISGENAGDIIDIEGVDGVLMTDDSYDDFGVILEVLEAVGED